MSSNPWAEFTPDFVLNTIENATGKKLTGFLSQRNSYINRVYEVECQDNKERWIAKFYRPNRWTPSVILNEHLFLKTLLNAEIPVIPPLEFEKKTLFNTNTIPLAIFQKKWGRAVDSLDQEGWQRLGRLLGRLHAVGETMTISDRPIWKPSVVTQKSLETLQTLSVIPEKLQKSFPQIVSQFIKKNDPLFHEKDFFLIHGDCHFGNLISREEEGLYLVDFDDCVIGPAIQDVWMLLPDTPDHCPNEISWFAQGYETFRDFPDSNLKLTPILSVMRQIHFAAWCALQKDEPHFQVHFQNWGTITYWEQLERELNT